MLHVVYKKTNGMLHDIQWKEEKDMDVDDLILEGWDHVPDIEEVKLLHDKEYVETQAKEAEIQAEIAKIKETEIQAYRIQAIANIEAKSGIRKG